EAVPKRSTRELWGPILDHVSQNSEPPVAVVQAAECQFPPILQRRNFFRWTANEPEALRALEEWVISLHGQQGKPAILPVHLPWFEGRQKELDLLWRTLVDRSGSTVSLCSED